MQLRCVVKMPRVGNYQGQQSYDMLCVEAQPATLIDAFHVVIDNATVGPKAGESFTLNVETIRPYPLDGRNRYDGAMVADPAKK